MPRVHGRSPEVFAASADASPNMRGNLLHVALEALEADGGVFLGRSQPVIVFCGESHQSRHVCRRERPRIRIGIDRVRDGAKETVNVGGCYEQKRRIFMRAVAKSVLDVSGNRDDLAASCGQPATSFAVTL